MGDRRSSTGPSKRRNARAWGNELVNREREVWRLYGWGGLPGVDGAGQTIDRPEKAWPEAVFKHSQQRDFFGRYDLMAVKRFDRIGPSVHVFVLIQVSAKHPSGPDHADPGPFGLTPASLVSAAGVEQLLGAEDWGGGGLESAIYEVYVWWRELEERPDPFVPGSFKKRGLPGGNHAGKMVWLVPDRRWWLKK